MSAPVSGAGLRAPPKLPFRRQRSGLTHTLQMPFSKQVRTASMGSLLAVASASAALGWSVPAAAQPSNTALAESLFREGKRLSSEKKFAEACPKFAESYRLDPGLGTLLNLATCHESEGQARLRLGRVQ